MKSLLTKNYTSRWSSKYLVRLSVHGSPCRADLYNKSDDTYCQISQMTPPGHRQTAYGSVYMSYTNQAWPAIIGLDLGKQTYSGCRLSGDGYEKRHNKHTGRITKMECRCVRRNIIQGASSILTHKYSPDCPLSKFAYRKKKELIYHGKATVAVANHMLRIGLALLHHHDIYCAAKEDNCEKLKAKLDRYKVSALASYLPQ